MRVAPHFCAFRCRRQNRFPQFAFPDTCAALLRCLGLSAQKQQPLPLPDPFSHCRSSKGYTALHGFPASSIDEHRSMLYRFAPLQLFYILVEQVFHQCSAPACSKPGQGAVVRYFPVLQQPHEVNPAPARFLQFSAAVDSALVSIHQYLKHYPCIGCRFSPHGRIRAIQFPIIQFL